MRSIGMDVHRSFAQVAIHEDGITAKSFRLELEHDTVVAFGKDLRPDDEVVREATGNTAAIVRLLKPFVARVVIANPMQVKAIAHARVKTDKAMPRYSHSCMPRASCPRSGLRMTIRSPCGGSSPNASRWCVRSAGRRAACMRCCMRT